MYFKKYILIIILFLNILADSNCLNEYEKLEMEDYELISAFNQLWILKVKCISKRLMLEFNIASLELFELALNQANLMYQNIEMVNEACDMIYGAFLLKYINDKNINHIQLIKKELQI